MVYTGSKKVQFSIIENGLDVSRTEGGILRVEDGSVVYLARCG